LSLKIKYPGSFVASNVPAGRSDLKHLTIPATNFNIEMNKTGNPGISHIKRMDITFYFHVIRFAAVIF